MCLLEQGRSLEGWTADQSEKYKVIFIFLKIKTDESSGKTPYHYADNEDLTNMPHHGKRKIVSLDMCCCPAHLVNRIRAFALCPLYS